MINIGARPVERTVFVYGKPMTMRMLLPWFFDCTIEAGGNLLPTNECMACFYYYVCAHNNRAIVGNSIDDQTIQFDVDASIMEMPLWHDKRYRAIAEAVAKLYGLNSPDEMFAYWSQVTQECFRLGLPAPEFEYMKPPAEDRIT